MGERVWVSAVLGAAVFWGALFAFGAVRPDYSQFTKAVSELGAIGVPNALAWNLVGFILTGLLLARCGARIARALEESRGALWWSLVLSGIAFAGTGVFPAVMQNGTPVMRAPLTVGHISMLLLSSLFWLVGNALLLRRAWRHPGWPGGRAALLIVTLLPFVGLAANLFHEVIPQLVHRPGLAQRLGFAGLFLWYVALAALMSARVTPRRAQLT